MVFRPLLAGIATTGIPTGDVFGNLWALDWVSRHLLEPRHLFAANVYYPDAGSLAYTESLLAQALVSGPLLAAGVPLVAAYNVVWLLTFPLSGLGAFLLARHVTRSRGGAALAGIAYAFSSYRLESLVHIQTLSIQWFPFVLLFLLKALETPNLLNLVALDAFVLLQALSSGYYAALLAPTLLIPMAFAARREARRALVKVVLALALAAVAAAPAFLPYWQAQRALDLQRHLRDLVGWSAGWSSYLRPSAQFWAPTLTPLQRAFQDGPAFYPGTTVVVFIAVALILRDRRALVPLALAAAGVLLSLGPEIQLGPWTLPGPYEALRTLPGFRLLRTPYRMAPMALVAFSALAAIGWAALEERWPPFRRWGWGLLLLATVEGAAVRTSRLFGPMPESAPYARWLAGAPRGPVMEIPWSTYDGPAVYASVIHRQRVVNGWGAFAPPDSIRIGMWGKRWPGPGAVHVLRGAGVRYVVVHTRRLPADQRGRLAAAGTLPLGVALVAQFDADRIYTISAEGPADPPPSPALREDP